MKVLHYCDTFSSLSQTFIYDVILELDRIEIDNVVAAVHVTNKVERPFHSVIKLNFSVKDVLFRIMQKGLSLVGVVSYDSQDSIDVLKRNSLAKVVKSQQPDILHAHFGNHGSVVLPVAEEYNVPLVVSFHGFDAFLLPNQKGWLEKLRSLFKGASLITVVSQLMKDQLISLGCPSEKLKIIHVGKQINDYTFNPDVNYPISNFISVGRLAEKKGHEDCIKAFSMLITSFPKLTLKIIGEGELKEHLENLIKSLGVGHFVELLGPKSHIETKDHFDHADAFILTSKTSPSGDMEGIPTVLMEAQFLGLPLVSTIHSGIPEVIPEANYWNLAREGDVEDISSKISSLILASKDLLSTTIANSRKKMEVEFNLTIEVRKLSQLYEQILNKKTKQI